ncbi:restriction endonuclease subunit S [Sulfuriferula sp.]|uniref:restriction endonuclease subunit S n=1 Tax=Sulfuriferula sp. TaxID=2025307 RepID=UPI00272F9C1F|nr:restriction endonuclease subunit S [Sulfuriferula sp.]MDP2025696.1 restriction endonuclease subunit S [Sulfuriferula sp.]
MSLPRYPEYKDSGVEWLGEVPGHWWIDRLKRSIERCKNGIWGDEAQGDEDDIPCVRVADFNRQQLTVALDEPTIRKVTEKERGGRVLSKGDLLLEKSGGGENQPVGCVVLYEDTRPAVCSNFVARMQIAADMDSSYWRYVHAAAYAIRLTTGSINQTSGIQNLDQDRYFNERVAFPPLKEQSTIASFLDRETRKIDALIAEQRQLVTLLAEKRQAVISHAITKGLNPNAPMKDSGIEWLGEVPGHWAVCALSYRFEVLLGKMLDEKRITGEHLAPYLRNADVQWGQINTIDLPEMDFKGDDLVRYALKPGDLLVCEGGDVGRAAVWVGTLQECYYQKALHRLRARNEDGDTAGFLFYVLYAAAKLGLFVGSEGRSTIAHLTAEALRRYQFAFPPLAEQQAIATFLDNEITKFDTLTAEANRAIALLQERRSALISATVTGKIDVRHACEVFRGQGKGGTTARLLTDREADATREV